MSADSGVGNGSPRPPDSDTGLLRRLLPYLWMRPWVFVGALLLYPLVAVTALLPPLIIRDILDKSLPAGEFALRWNAVPQVGEVFFLDPSTFIPWLGVAFGAAVLFDYLAGFLSQYMMGVVGLGALRDLRRDLFAKVQRLPASYFDHQPMGRVLTRLTNDVEALVEVFSTGTVTAVADIIKIVVVVVAMLSMSFKLTFLSLLVTPILIGVSVVFRMYTRRAYRLIRKTLSQMNTFLAEHLRGMAVVQLFRQQERTARRFSKLNTEYRDANQDAILFDAALFAIVQALGVFTVAALLFGGASSLASGAVQVGVLIAFVEFSRRVFEPLRDLAQKFNMLQSALAAAERVFQLLDEPEVQTKTQAAPVHSIERGIEFQDVWFRYPSSVQTENPWVLKGLDMRISRGEKVALVGSTGSGKSTILRLLNRSYDIDQGSLCIGGVPLKELDLASLRSLFGYVLQDVFLFEGSLGDNLSLLGRSPREEMEEATRSVGAFDTVQRHGGFEGNLVARGQNMSVGERQMISFARALTVDPQVLVLDEATSHIDSETEARVQQALQVLLQDRTAVMVAHRLSTIRRADRIVVLEDGKVSEEGDHEALVAAKGFYARLVDLQTSHGRPAPTLH